MLRAKLTTLAGEVSNAAELREYADSYQPGLGATFTFHCRKLQRTRPPDIASRTCSRSANAWTTTAPTARPPRCWIAPRVQRRDQGCGKGFRIAGVARR